MTIKERPEVYARLDKRLRDARAEAQVEKRTNTGLVAGGTIAVAETDLDLKLPTKDLIAGSARTGKWFDLSKGAYDLFPPPNTFGSAQNHAEQGLLGKISQAIEQARLEDEALEGHTVSMHVDQIVCSTCKAGLGSPKNPGVLKQFSLKYPGLILEITNQENAEVVRVRGGRRIITLWSPLSVQQALAKPRAKALPRPKASKSSRVQTARSLLSQISANEWRPLFNKDGAAMIKALDDQELNRLYQKLKEKQENTGKTLAKIRENLQRIIQTLQEKIGEIKKGEGGFLASFKGDVMASTMGIAALELADLHEISVIRGEAGEGSSYDWDLEGQFTVVIDPEEQKDSTLIYQVRRVDALLETDRNKYTREKYVQVMIDKEVDSYSRALRHNIELAGPKDRMKLDLQVEFEQASGKIQSIREGYGDRPYLGGTYTSYYQELWEQEKRRLAEETTMSSQDASVQLDEKEMGDSNSTKSGKGEERVLVEQTTEPPPVPTASAVQTPSDQLPRGKSEDAGVKKAPKPSEEELLEKRIKDAKESIRVKEKRIQELDEKLKKVQIIQNSKEEENLLKQIKYERDMKTRVESRLIAYESRKSEGMKKIFETVEKSTETIDSIKTSRQAIARKRSKLADRRRKLEKTVNESQRAEIQAEIQDIESALQTLIEERDNANFPYLKAEENLKHVKKLLKVLNTNKIQEERRLEELGIFSSLDTIQKDIEKLSADISHKKRRIGVLKTKSNIKIVINEKERSEISESIKNSQQELEGLKDQRKELEEELDVLKTIRYNISTEKRKKINAKEVVKRVKKKKNINTISSSSSSNEMDTSPKLRRKPKAPPSQRISTSLDLSQSKGPASQSKKRQPETDSLASKRIKTSEVSPVTRTVTSKSVPTSSRTRRNPKLKGNCSLKQPVNRRDRQANTKGQPARQYLLREQDRQKAHAPRISCGFHRISSSKGCVPCHDQNGGHSC